MVVSLQPTVVLLQVGSNDLCQLDKSVQEIEHKLIGLVLTFKYYYHVQRVSVLQILHRQWPRQRIRYSVDIPWFNHRRLCRVNNMLAMYLKYHKAGLTPTTPVTSIAIYPIKMSIGCKSLTNLRSEMIFFQGKPIFYICLPSTPPY